MKSAQAPHPVVATLVKWYGYFKSLVTIQDQPTLHPDHPNANLDQPNAKLQGTYQAPDVPIKVHGQQGLHDVLKVNIDSDGNHPKAAKELTLEDIEKLEAAAANIAHSSGGSVQWIGYGTYKLPVSHEQDLRYHDKADLPKRTHANHWNQWP